MVWGRWGYDEGMSIESQGTEARQGTYSTDYKGLYEAALDGKETVPSQEIANQAKLRDEALGRAEGEPFVVGESASVLVDGVMIEGRVSAVESSGNETDHTRDLVTVVVQQGDRTRTERHSAEQIALWQIPEEQIRLRGGGSPEIEPPVA